MIHRNPKYWWDKTNYCVLCLHNDSTSARLYCDTEKEMDEAMTILAFSTYTVKIRAMICNGKKWLEYDRLG